jgi:cytochrome d ubiquinol oxidase subunit II
VDAVEVEDAAGSSATLWGLIGVFGIAGVTVVPALVYLYVLTQRDGGLGDDQPVAPTTAP